MLKITSFEKRVLVHLLENGKQPINEIAKKMGVTRQTVAKKMEQMKDLGLISTFIPKLEPEKFGLTTQAYIFMREDPQNDTRKKNEERIKSYNQVAEFHRIFGKYDSIVKVLVKNNQEVTDFVRILHGLSGVRETETYIIHSTIKNKPEDPFKKILSQ
jgi:Lrp/AsnC family leucine-responsive transcriptional regulator